jgi:ElaB/YqjD/DUF883 family membrane-anchored ribosome-binding protein
MAERLDGGRLAEDLRALVSDAETLLRDTANVAGADLQERAQATLREMRVRLAAIENSVRERARDVDGYVHENPWQAVAVTGAVALLLGLILGRR